MSGAIDRRELTFKALAGLVGGAIGWLPVEIVNHGHTLNEQLTRWEQFGQFFSMALMAGMIGGMILAADGQTLEITAQTKRRFMRGFILCFILAIPANYYSNITFRLILQAGGWNLDHPGSSLLPDSRAPGRMDPDGNDARGRRRTLDVVAA